MASRQKMGNEEERKRWRKGRIITILKIFKLSEIRDFVLKGTKKILSLRLSISEKQKNIIKSVRN